MRKLVTCPVCNTDQHIYAKRITKHMEGDMRRGWLQCKGSGISVSPITGKADLPTWGKVQKETK